MGADNGRHEVGDIVTPRKKVKGLKCGHPYTISSIERGLDGAYDYDDIYLKEKPGSFCEFDLDTVERGTP